MNKKTVRDLDVAHKKVLVRVDFNVPMDEQGNITDDTRIREALPTIQYLLEQKAKVILISHLGRPKGKVVDQLRLGPVANRLSELLGKPVLKTEDSIGPSAADAVAKMDSGGIVLLENIRFYPEEEKNDAEFARKISGLGDIFVLDAFGTAHRAHASTVGIASYLPAVAGFLMEKELTVMGDALDHPQRPFAAIIGGAKVSDKIGVIENLLTKTDFLLIGGGMANTFLQAEGHFMGASLVESDKVSVAADIMKKADHQNKKIYLPVDVVVAETIADDIPVKVVSVNHIPDGWMALDIGPETIKLFSQRLAEAKTVIWNGPMGVFERAPFAQGTKAVAQAIANSESISIIGGGDSAAAVEKFGFSDAVTHISTGGGASLEFMEGIELPGVAALLDQ